MTTSRPGGLQKSHLVGGASATSAHDGKQTVQAEKEALSEQEQKSAKTALTELFQETKTEQTPAVVEWIVNDIDSIVKFVRFEGWQDSVPGQKQVQKALRQSLLKYKLHKDDELFDMAYGIGSSRVGPVGPTLLTRPVAL